MPLTFDVPQIEISKDFPRRHDPQHERQDEIFERLGHIDIQHLMPRLKSLCACGK